MPEFAFRIRGMDCAEEVSVLKRELGPLVGDEDRLKFDLLNGKLTVDAPAEVSVESLTEAINRTGMHAEPWAAPGVADREHTRRRRRFRFVWCGVAVLLLLAGFVVHGVQQGFLIALAGGLEDVGIPVTSVVLYALATAAGIWFVLPRAWLAARRLRPDMHLLMTVAVLGAAAIGEWFEAATVSILFAVALLLESWSVSRARHAIEALMDLSPQTARYLCPSDGEVNQKPVEEVPVGVIAVVRPGEKVPMDGEVTEGETSVNQAPITGESSPVDKGPGDKVFAGSINNEGAFQFRVTRPYSDTTLARIIHMVSEAQARRAPTELWVEKFARYYTPAMMALAIAIAVVPPLFVGAWTQWFYQGLVILVIACPCALVISTPVSIVAGLASAARAGVLVKGGAYLELPARVRAIALDKTGTLTVGHPEVQQVIPVPPHTVRELIQRAAAIEAHSEHPVARAILRYAEHEGIPFEPSAGYRAVKGKGGQANLGERPFWAGSRRYAHELGMEDSHVEGMARTLEDAGHSVVFVGNDQHICGVISVADRLRPEAAEAVGQLRGLGIEPVVMLTGDNQGTARAIAEEAGVSDFRAELLPEDKVRAVARLVRELGAVAMIGDGVNDAPAMATANLGIAMGAVGTDAAIETADVALMSDDLRKVAWLVRHGRRALRIIRQNIVFSLGLKALFIALAAGGYATLWMAIAADMGASLIVIFNALRLLQRRP